MKYSAIIIGGGLAGLTSSIELAKRGFKVLLIERKSYPHHKVCGEYVSNEVKPYLIRLGLNLEALRVSELNQLWFTSPKGSSLVTDLDMGGFGVSRYLLDEALYKLALSTGVEFRLKTTVTAIEWEQEEFRVQTSEDESLTAEMVIGAYGKRTRLDKQMNRQFMSIESPYVGVKYHVRATFPTNVIALHNFKNGYCGMSAIEDDKYCLCYLTRRSNLKDAGSIEEMEQSILCKNPHLKEIFTQAEFLYSKPEVINEVSFARKECVENHVLMAGDSAGLITPLCGNGMAMAIRAGNMVATQVASYLSGQVTRCCVRGAVSEGVESGIWYAVASRTSRAKTFRPRAALRSGPFLLLSHSSPPAVRNQAYPRPGDESLILKSESRWSF